MDKLENEREYIAALSRIEKIWNADTGTVEGAELDCLVTLVENYEGIHYPIDPPSEEVARQFRQEQEATSAFHLTRRKYFNALRRLSK